ncbi:HAMP domain-containing histidine kinase [Paracrocinitomix mangrovi]|uniref:sensor histidine kinase n=1 Tax=Paracrocinitomix mangrovi TaxID=2862509 RepID=UPI001C8D62F7|nr:HAMP domain-containing sensor histidine kinase [Paracrocinitomix mangrovi]UKN00381.1 HAMP domain-containing histidine kinase [Paracrocinitomix mangrovi]
MNLYHKKQRWKIALLGVAILLVAVSLWFSFRIVDKVQQREVDRIEQWADAVKRKSELVSLTNNAFDELSDALESLKERDRQKVEMWSLAIQEVNKPLEDYSFVVEIIKGNNDIPIIITDNKEEVISSYNLSALDTSINRMLRTSYSNEKKSFQDSLKRKAKKDSLNSYKEFWRKDHPPLEIDLDYGDKQMVFYFDSIFYKTQKLTALEYSRDSLIDAFSDELVTNEYLVPVLFVDVVTGDVIATNREDYDSTNAASLIQQLRSTGDSIVVELSGDRSGVIYYEHSEEITQMKFFPIVQFFIIGLFVLIAYLAFSTFRKAEQDQVWAGMAKETAHQLGTPISSLMAWNQLLEAKGTDESITKEINKDIDRLNMVTNRFSKIGSQAALEEQNIVEVVDHAISYLKNRISSKVDLQFVAQTDKIMVRLNEALLEWAVENIVKNAVDSMESNGNIKVTVSQQEDDVFIDIEDDGKGIPANKIKSVFRPGYTTKKRGWGLGLSLVKRIIEEFHNGKVFVLNSEVGKGTTFRIQLPV